MTATKPDRTRKLSNALIRQKRAELRRYAGIPGHVPGPTVAAHLTKLLDAHWTRTEIAAASGMSERAIRYILSGQKIVQHDTAVALFKVRPSDSLRVSATGSVRRIQGLAYQGWTIVWTAAQIDRGPDALHKILNGEKVNLLRDTAETLAGVYKSHGDKVGPSVYTQAVAKRNEWSPPHTWDDDTIDDPAAVPQWTGHCGSDRGWWTHRLTDIPSCQACEKAHAKWLQEHAGLSGGERMSAMAKSRATASNRGADIAHDARELMRFGADYETAAARIGVTRQHLQQELQRHKEVVAA